MKVTTTNNVTEVQIEKQIEAVKNSNLSPKIKDGILYVLREIIVRIEYKDELKGNPLNLYSASNESAHTKADILKANKIFKKAWSDFKIKLNIIRYSNEDVGMSDTASREAQIIWIQEHAEEVM